MSFNPSTLRESLLQCGVTSAEMHVLVAVSGGVDSVVLCDALHRCGQRFSIAHVNYGLRGDESDADEKFVRALSEKYQVDCFVLNARDEMSSASGIQEAARNIRYGWFAKLLDEHRFAFYLTAHHLDDQAETILFQFIRGGYLPALRGMLKVKNRHIRPLLDFNRMSLLNYAGEHKLQWREDASNREDYYQRNYLRNQVMPMLERINPDVRNALVKRAEVIRQMELLQEHAIEEELQRFLKNSGDEKSLLIADLSQSLWPDLIFKKWLLPYGFSEQSTGEVKSLLTALRGARVESASWSVWRNAEQLTLALNDVDLVEEEITRLPFRSQTAPAIYIRRCELNEVDFSKSPTHLFLDAGDLKWPLKIRRWKDGDRFKPLGFSGTKKLSDFLMQVEVPAEKKRQIRVLVSGEDIIAVPGYRPASAVKVSPESQSVICVSFDSA